MRIAVIADVHGNLVALEAVLDHLRTASPDLVVNLGDTVSGPFTPAEAANAQMAMNCQTLRGNHDRTVLTDPSGESDGFAAPLLSAAHRAWLENLQPTLTLADGEVFACHGSPAGGDLEYLLEDVTHGAPMLDTVAAITPRLAGIGDARVVLCGHTHVARVTTVTGILVVNPGSVGMPCYADDTPVPHVVQAGSPHARYATLDRTAAGWTAELRALAYDFETAARQAKRAGRPEIAHSVRTGWPPLTEIRGVAAKRWIIMLGIDAL